MFILNNMLAHGKSHNPILAFYQFEFTPYVSKCLLAVALTKDSPGL